MDVSVYVMKDHLHIKTEYNLKELNDNIMIYGIKNMQRKLKHKNKLKKNHESSIYFETLLNTCRMQLNFSKY